jgi:hypothetical protein
MGSIWDILSIRAPTKSPHSIRHTNAIYVALLVSPCHIYIAINDRTLRFVMQLSSIADVHVRKLLGVLMCSYLRPIESDWPSRDGLGGRCGTKCDGILNIKTDIDYDWCRGKKGENILHIRRAIFCEGAIHSCCSNHHYDHIGSLEHLFSRRHEKSLS